MRAPQHWFVCPAELHAVGCRSIPGLQRNVQGTSPALVTVHTLWTVAVPCQLYAEQCL